MIQKHLEILSKKLYENNKNAFSENKYLFGDYVIVISGNYSLSSKVFFGNISKYKSKKDYYHDKCEAIFSSNSEKDALDQCCEYLENKLGNHCVMDILINMKEKK